MKGFNLALQPGRVGDQVLSVVAQHQELIGTYPPEPDG